MANTYPGTIHLDLTRDGTLARLEWLSWFTDSAIRIPGTTQSFGADGLLSIIPGAGSLAGTGISLYLLAEAVRHGAPLPLLMRMGGNVAADMVVGAIPVIGFAFDMVFKANQRNLRLLREHMKGNT
jgi:hypothetical protein